MRLLDHVSIAVRDIAAAKCFYRAALGALGAAEVYERPDAIGFGERNRAGDDGHSYLSVFEAPEATATPRRHWCFRAASAAMVRDFHRAGLAAGGTDAGAPGLRDYHPGYYAAFLCDPDGNKVEAVFHGGAEAPSRHGWLLAGPRRVKFALGFHDAPGCARGEGNGHDE